MAEESFAKRAAKQRDAEILHSLLKCFNKRGCFETTLDQVAADVGIGKGTLYRHYSSREDLFEAALQAGIEGLIVRCHGIWDAHAPDFDAALRVLIGEFVSLNHREDPRRPAHEADIASRIVGVLRRAFAPAPQSTTAVMGL